MKRLISVCLFLSFSAIAGQTPQGSTLRKSSQIKTKTFEVFYLFRRSGTDRLSNREMSRIDRECEARQQVLDSALFNNFSMDDLVAGEDVVIYRNLPNERFYAEMVNISPAIHDMACKFYVKVNKAGYMVTTEEFEFLNAANCAAPLDLTKVWMQNPENQNYLQAKAEMIKFSRQERRRRDLPRNAKACVVTTVSIQKTRI